MVEDRPVQITSSHLHHLVCPLLQSHQPMMSLILQLLVLLSICSFQLVSAQIDKFQNCSTSFQCGNITGIGYPFLGSARPSYCGHPNFHLACSGQTATMSMSGLTYQVLNINNSNRVLTLARTDYLTGICSEYLHNNTIDPNHFTYIQDTLNLTIYYKCPTSVPSSYASALGLSTEIECTINGTESSGYYTVADLRTNLGNAIAGPIYDALDSCSNRFVAPAIQSVVVGSLWNAISPTEDDLVAVLEQGFGLFWDADNTDASCSACKGSGGACGYSDERFSCYCSSGKFSMRCNDVSSSLAPSQSSSPSEKDSKNASLPIGIGIGGAAIFGIFLGVLFLIFAQRRKQKAAAENQSKELHSQPPTNKNKNVHPPPADLSMSIPPYPYSNSYPKSEPQKGSSYFGLQIFSFTELEEATDNFNPVKELGTGGFGSVYHGILRDGRSVAVKRLFDNSIKREEQFMNEVEILNRLRHRNLVTLYGCTSRRTRELIFVFEYVPNGTVADHIHGEQSKSRFLPWPVRLNIAIETADALAYLHTSDVIHRDVKTNNILLDNNFSVKVADFGLSRLFPNNVTHVSTAPQGTPGYVDPEYYNTYQLTDKSDVYSFGVVLIELISSLPAVDTSRQRLDINLSNMAVTKIQSGSISELIDPLLGSDKDNSVRKMATSIAELAFRCLQQERDMRPTMNEVHQALRRIQNENCPTGKCETVVEIGEDDVSLLKKVSPPLSPDSVETDQWISSSTLSSS